MTDRPIPHVPLTGDHAELDAALQRQWRNRARLSSVGDVAERFLESAGFDRGPWLAVAFMAGIALWFLLPTPAAWIAAILGALLAAALAQLAWREEEGRNRMMVAATGCCAMLAAGLSVVWARSAIVGTEAIPRPMVGTFDARILDRIEQPAQERLRLVLVTREPETARAIKVRLNVPLAQDSPELAEGAVIRLRARLMPPAPPMLPGSYDFARAAWFNGLAATGSALGPIAIVEPSPDESSLARLRERLSAHVRSQLGGSPGTIAAAFASGDRGAIAEADEDAMRDAGLTHLLSISGLHVSALIAAAYLLAIRLLALWPWFALRVRLPLVAAGIGALAGIAYTLLTGAEVPTIRSCVAAVLVLLALTLGREPLSLRMVAVAALFVLLLWPESLVGPSFQMSFAAVIAIVAIHTSAPVRLFLEPREEGWPIRMGRHAVMLLVTGIAIELALMPIGLFHFHRAGIYGALANVIAIPLTTFISMPLIALALLLDLVGAGAPAWWLVGKSLEMLLALAHWTAGQPGAVPRLPTMGEGAFALCIAGGLWLALWRRCARLLGLIPAGIGSMLMVAEPVPDILVSGDGRHVGITQGQDRLLVLRDSRSDFARENMLESAGMAGDPVPLARWPEARCSPDFCVITLDRGGRDWHVLMARSRNIIEERGMMAACERADIVIADRWLPRSCKPRWLKADCSTLSETGGLAIDLSHRSIRTVAQQQGEHGWWKGNAGRMAWHPVP